MSDPPYYRRIVDDLRMRIARGEWSQGDRRLPSTRELVEHYRHFYNYPRLSRLTVRRAVEMLIEAGELYGQQGVGVFVAGPPKS